MPKAQLKKAKRCILCMLFGHRLVNLPPTPGSALIVTLATEALQGSEVQLTGRYCKWCHALETAPPTPPEPESCIGCNYLAMLHTNALTGAKVTDIDGAVKCEMPLKKTDTIRIGYCMLHDHQVDPCMPRICHGRQ